MHAVCLSALCEGGFVSVYCVRVDYVSMHCVMVDYVRMHCVRVESECGMCVCYVLVYQDAFNRLLEKHTQSEYGMVATLLSF